MDGQRIDNPLRPKRRYVWKSSESRARSAAAGAKNLAAHREARSRASLPRFLAALVTSGRIPRELERIMGEVDTIVGAIEADWQAYGGIPSSLRPVVATLRGAMVAERICSELVARVALIDQNLALTPWARLLPRLVKIVQKSVILLDPEARPKRKANPQTVLDRIMGEEP